MKRIASGLFLASMLIAASASAGQAEAHVPVDRVSLSIQVGLDPAVAGPFNREAETSGRFGTVRLFDHTFDQVYGEPFRLAGEFGYAVSNRCEVLGRVAYAHATANPFVDFGEAISRDTGSRSLFRAGFGNYRSWSFQGGMRWHLS